MAASVPKDKFLGVWLILFSLGLGTLLPWNFFMTATVYFTSRLKDVSLAEAAANHTALEGGADQPDPSEHSSVLQEKFNNVMTLCAMLPLLLFTCLNSLLLSLVSQKVRVLGSLLVIMSAFVATAALVRVPLEPLPFFCLTMATIVIINSSGAMLQGSLFGMAASLPASYTTPIMSGQGAAGTFAALAMICAIASGSELNDAAFGYFITAVGVIFLSVLSYLLLPRLEFFQFYQDRNRKEDPSKEESDVKLMNIENKGEAAENKPQEVSMWKIFKKIWRFAVLVCMCFTVTIGTFPAITADTKSSFPGGSWEQYFIPVSCFLMFNLFDWSGRSLTAFSTWPGKDSCILPVCVVCRLVFPPLFMLCNVQPRHLGLLPVYFHHDGFFIGFMALFAFSNGYLASLCMCFGPKNVLPHEAETAGSIMAFFLSLGLALGAASSFVTRALV